MNKHYPASSFIYQFCSNPSQVIHVFPNEEISIETIDCFANQIKSEQDVLETIDFSRVNPATGPFYIEGAKPGMTLKININQIKTASQGVVVVGKDLGTLGHLLTKSYTKIISLHQNQVLFNEQLLSTNPMIGVIGVAPKNESINTGTPGDHGGNMDNTMITAGSILYLPIQVEGALFAVGDVHIMMGDGEIGVSGLEANAVITLSFELLDQNVSTIPFLETELFYSTIGSDITLDSASLKATEAMFHFLKKQLKLKEEEIVMLMSLSGNLQVCQIVDPLKTVRYVIKKEIVKKFM